VRTHITHHPISWTRKRHCDDRDAQRVRRITAAY
jgi:hypothetical protein